MKTFPKALALTITLLSFNALASDSGWIKQEVDASNEHGFTIKTIVNSDQGIKLITVAVPKSKLKNNKEEIDEVIVIGKRSEERESPLKNISYEWADDFENGDYGLIIKLKDDSKMPLKLQFSADKSLTRP